MKKLFVLILILCLLLLSSCELFHSGKEKTITSFDLNSLKSLYLKTASTANKGVTKAGNDGLLAGTVSAINTQNEVESVYYTDSKGNHVSSESFHLQPVKITDYGKDFFIVRYQPYPAKYLINKNNGKALCLNMVDNNPTNYSMGVFDITFGEDNCIYYRCAHLNHETWMWLEIKKGDLSTGNSWAISPSNLSIYRFGRDSQGNILGLIGPSNNQMYNYCACSNIDGILTIDKNGNTKQYPMEKQDFNWGTTMFVDGRDQFWISVLHDGLYKINLGEDKASTTYIKTEHTVFEPIFFGNRGYYLIGTITNGNSDGGEPIFKREKVNSYLYYFDFDTEKEFQVDTGSFQMTQLVKEGNFLYALGEENGQSKIIRINPTDNSYETVVATDVFEIKTFTISDLEGISFEGSKRSTGEAVVGVGGRENGGWLRTVVQSASSAYSGLTKVQ